MTRKKNRKKIIRKTPKLKKSVKTKKVTKKKRPSKKRVSFLRVQKEKIEISKIVAPILEKIREEAPIIQTPVKKEIPRRLTNSFPSRHVVDLRKIQAEKYHAGKNREKHAETITEEIINLLGRKNVMVSKNVKKTPANIKTSASDGKLRAGALNRPPVGPSLPRLRSAGPSIHFPKSSLAWPKALAFAIVCLIVISPLFAYDQYQNLLGKKDSILQETATALSHLSLSGQAASAHDLYYLQKELSSAGEGFNSAEKSVNDVNLLVQQLIKITPEIGDKYAAAKKLISAGKDLSNSAALLTAAFEKFTDRDDNAGTLTEKISSLKDSLNIVLPDLISVDENLAELNISDLPADYQEKISTLQKTLPILEKSISYFTNYTSMALQILGQDNLKRYLILFQNSDEIRPTGGFIGSYALLDLYKGEIKKISIPGGGPYDLKSSLKISLSAPRPLRVLNQRWEFQDANWFADLPTSADKISWLYEKSGGPTVDGLIFINSYFVKNLLQITGPIELRQYGKTISSDNFIQEVQSSVEFEYDKDENRPKQIISDLAQELISRLSKFDGEKIIDAADLLYTSLYQKDVQLYFKDYSLEKKVLNNNWGGQVKKTDGDYLQIVSTNIAGEKTDARISESADLKIAIDKDGSVTNTLTLKKTHAGIKGEPLYGVDNLDYLRLYVPKGSGFISASGFELMEPELFDNLDPEVYAADQDLAQIDASRQIDPQTRTEVYDEGDKTVLANWMKVEPGETKTVSLSWKLPFKIKPADSNAFLGVVEALKKGFNISEDGNGANNNYSLLWQKQSGKNINVNISLNFPDSAGFKTVYPEIFSLQDNSINFSEILNSDKFFAVTFNKP
ncbi:MAG: DUF4012 domain-containing protein [Patescibacteria group bacterium]|nr:DUF4012 domain-containing protein [Patescibacteria group bacterium]